MADICRRALSGGSGASRVYQRIADASVLDEDSEDQSSEDDGEDGGTAGVRVQYPDVSEAWDDCGVRIGPTPLGE